MFLNQPVISLSDNCVWNELSVSKVLHQRVNKSPAAQRLFMRNPRNKKRILIPLLVFILELAAYAQKINDNKPISGHLQSDACNEISGLTASLLHNGIYYIHNDSGDTSRFFAITADGNLKATCYYNTGKSNQNVIDCEDIAAGPGPEKGKSYIYIGDIGDNNGKRGSVNIYRLPEPALPADAAKPQLLEAARLQLNYPDGARDAETLMIDPIDRLLYIVSKRENEVSVYTAPLSFKDGDTVNLISRSKLKLKGFKPFKWVVGGSISKDGQQILIKTYSKVFYWRRKANEPVWQTLQQKPKELLYEQEKQGEAIAFAIDGKSYYTVSEGKKAPIYHYRLK